MMPTWLLLGLAANCAGEVLSQLQVVPDARPQLVFAGPSRKIDICWHNPGTKAAESDLRVRLFQTTSATAALISEMPWKRLQLRPGQTVLESLRMDLPSVRAKTSFLVHWVEGTNHVLGSTEFWVYPTNLLAEMGLLADGGPLGVLDPEAQITPSLIAAGVEIEDLCNRELDSFAGSLAVLGPFKTHGELTPGFTDRVAKLATKGVAVVWIQGEERADEKLAPSYYSVAVGRGTVIVAQPGMVSSLSERPAAQLSLVRLAGQAIKPEPHVLPQSPP